MFFENKKNYNNIQIIFFSLKEFIIMNIVYYIYNLLTQMDFEF